MAKLPPDTRAVGTPDPAGDMDNVIDALAAITGATPGGADPGAGTVTAQKALNTLAGGVTSGQFLRGNGTNVLLAAIQAADVPALNYAALLTPTGVKTTGYTASAGDLVPCDTSGGGFTVTAPTAPAAQAQIAVVLMNGTNPVTIAAGGTDVFDKAAGPTSITLYPGPGPGPSAILLQYRASGNIWYRYGGYNPSPLTTLGDTPYGGTGGAPTRLAGNSSATKNFLTQTGNGSVSAAPAWGTIAAGDVPTLNQNTTGTAANVTGTVAIANGGTGQTAQQAALNALAGAQTNNQVLAGNGTNITVRALAAADLPAATTSLQGAVILTGTATDIQSLGTQAAGNSTKAAPANHVHAAGAGSWLPGDDGFLGANSDPAYASGGGLAVDQTLYLQRITPRVASTVTNLWYCLSAIGTDGGTGVFFVGLWDSAGNLLSGSSNLVSSTTSGTGYKAFALTTPQAVTAGNIYFAGLLPHLTATQPTFLRQNNSTNAAPQASVNIATARWSAKASFGTSLTNATLSGFAQTAFTFIVAWT